MTVKCGECKFFSCDFPEFRVEFEQDDPDMGVLGECNWHDSIKLPYAWRWTTREVVGVYSLEPIICDAFVAIEKVKTQHID
jgi:hypothetical protein